MPRVRMSRDVNVKEVRVVKVDESTVVSSVFKRGTCNGGAYELQRWQAGLTNVALVKVVGMGCKR